MEKETAFEGRKNKSCSYILVTSEFPAVSDREAVQNLQSHLLIWGLSGGRNRSAHPACVEAALQELLPLLTARGRGGQGAPRLTEHVQHSELQEGSHSEEMGREELGSSTERIQVILFYDEIHLPGILSHSDDGTVVSARGLVLPVAGLRWICCTEPDPGQASKPWSWVILHVSSV